MPIDPKTVKMIISKMKLASRKEQLQAVRVYYESQYPGKVHITERHFYRIIAHKPKSPK